MVSSDKVCTLCQEQDKEEERRRPSAFQDAGRWKQGRAHAFVNSGAVAVYGKRARMSPVSVPYAVVTLTTLLLVLRMPSSIQ